MLIGSVEVATSLLLYADGELSWPVRRFRERWEAIVPQGTRSPVIICVGGKTIGLLPMFKKPRSGGTKWHWLQPLVAGFQVRANGFTECSQAAVMPLQRTRLPRPDGSLHAAGVHA